jgi:NADH-quinone oxidoreductase subunit J
VMVLFLFIIMLLDLRAEKLRKINWPATAGGIAVAVVFLAQVLSVIGRYQPAGQSFPPLTGTALDDVRGIGMRLFESYNLPLQIIGILVLVATIGVVVLSKREVR